MSLTQTLTLLVMLLHLAGMLAAMHAVMHARTAQGAFAWAFGLALLPYLTLVPYLYLGRSHFQGYITLHRVHQRRLSQAALRGERTEVPEPCAPYAALTRMLGNNFHGGQRVQLLVNGDATFEAIIKAIAQAEQCILMQFFIIHDDALGRRVQHALLERAAAGVKVFVLFDGIGSHALPEQYVETLRRGGVAIHPFATQRFSNRFQLNFRNHRKIVVVDGWVGFLGGLNVGDEYLGLSPPLAPWRDTHLQVSGPAVLDLQRSFAVDWHWVTGELPPILPVRPAQGDTYTLIAATGPADPQESCSLYFTTVINAARKRLWLTTPYFVPDQAVMSALRLAVLRGVDVRVLIPSRPDHRTVFLASTLHAYDAIRAGIRIFRYQPGFIHEKVILIDDDGASVGSMNLDNRSFRLNFEVGALNVDRAFAERVESMLLEDFSRAVEVKRDEYRKAPYWRRLAMHLARLCDPIL
ncbi:cardiolipin synthase [Dyella mobilis]|uniref:Cardiolipin synthase n=1 Tax=Dyella mobilis TaxID=1849582 RepID=A0ABS2KIB1_9GAMM|nr:cardiolipin synthase [Dyella mobilis]MBM7130118.1 cardiolipin synthase [Dyella mobilis]GLQ96745.1 cardiolipin synthase A [Dyella mobilis]